MEILFVSHKFPPAIGGMEKQSYELITGMEKRCKVHRLIYDGKGNKFLFLLSLRKRIKKICDEHPGISIIHYNDGLLASFCLFHKLNKQIAYTVTLHGLDVVFPSKFYRKHILRRFNKFSLMISVSQATARKVIDFGIDPGKVVVVPNGVDEIDSEPMPQADYDRWLEEKQLSTSRKLLLMMGRPVLRKGFSWFVENVLPLIRKDYFLLIVGPFKKEKSITENFVYLLPQSIRHIVMLFFGYASDEKKLRRLLESNQDVKHLGRLPREEINGILQHVDAFLMPNIHVDGDMEGFGLVCLEAAVQGALVIASEIDGIPDAIQNNKNGILLPPENAGKWVEVLEGYTKNTDRYKQRLPEYSRYSKENYSWERMVDAYYDLFEKISQ